MKSILRRVRARGFTLVELLVVMVILGILITLMLPRIADALFQAKVTDAKAKGRAIVTAIISKTMTSENFSGWPLWKEYKDADLYFDMLVTNKLLGYRNFIVAEIKEANDGTEFKGGGYNAWRIVADLNDSTPENMPVIFTKNNTIARTGAAPLKKDLDDTLKPFGQKGFVYVMKDGSAQGLSGEDMDKATTFNTKFPVYQSTNDVLKAKEKPTP